MFSSQSLSSPGWKIVIMTIVLPATFYGINTAFGGPTDELFINVPISMELYARQEKEKEDPTIIRSRYARVNFDLLTKSDVPVPDTLQPSPIQKSPIVLNLFNDVSFTAMNNRIEVRAENRYTWYGHIKGMAHSQVILVVEDGSMAGDIRVSGDLYEIRPIGEGIHAIYEIDQSAFPQDAEPIPVP